MFWKRIDEVLNAVPFLMIGVTVMVVPISGHVSVWRSGRSRSEERR
jgi:hypothetical protein